MKNVTMAFLGAALCLGACQKNETQVTLHLEPGQASGFSLVDMATRDTVSQTSEVKDDGTMVVRTAASDTLLAVVMLGDSVRQVVVLDGEPLELDFTGGKRDVVKGSKANKTIADVNARLRTVAAGRDSVMQDFDALKTQCSGPVSPARIDSLYKRMDRYDEIEKGIFREAIEANRDNALAAWFVLRSEGVLDYDLLENFLKDYAYKDLYALESVHKSIVAEKRKQVGVALVDFSMQDMQGKTHKMSEYVGQGKWVLVDFWASWCGPCRKEMPTVKACYEKYQDKGFQVVGVSLDSDSKAWAQGVADLGITWPQMSDLKGWESLVVDLYGIRSIPATLLFDPDGKVAASGLRGEELESKLAEVFAK